MYLPIILTTFCWNKTILHKKYLLILRHFCCTFNHQVCILPLFLVLFFHKINLHSCSHITKYFNVKESGHFDKFVFGLVCRYINLLTRGLGSTLGPRSCCIFNFKICIFLLSWALFVEIKQFYIKIFINSQTFLCSNVCKNTLIITDKKGYGLHPYNVELCT